MRSVASFVVLLICGWGSLAGQTVDPTRNAFVATQDPLGEPVTSVTYLAQNWSPSQSVQFYFTSQGSQILPYDWFLASNSRVRRLFFVITRIFSDTAICLKTQDR